MYLVESLDSFPFPPKEVIETPAGAEAVITAYTDNPERKAISAVISHASAGSKSLYPREIDVPTTSRYARGSE